MRIVVCVKQVPEVSELSLDPVTRRLARDGVPAWMNPFDRRAVLEAIRLRAELGGSITAVTMGPPAAEAVLRECLGLGVDRAVHLCDPALAGSDTLATARALADAIRAIGFDLALAGLFSIDSETGQVGPELAALLEVPLLSGVRRLEASEGTGGGPGRWRLVAECQSDDGFFEVAGETPAVATCTDRWRTRTPRVLPDEGAARGAVERWSISELGGPRESYGAAGSPTWVGEIRRVEVRRRGRVLRAGDEAELERAVESVLEEVEVAASAARAACERPRHGSTAAPEQAVWVVGERAPDGGIRRVSAELLGAADGLAHALGTGVAVFLLEPPPAPGVEPGPGLGAMAAELGQLGADVLLAAAGAIPGAAGPETLGAALAEAIAVYRPRVVLGPATALGRDVLAAAAARLGIGLTGDAIGVALDAEGRLEQLKPAFGGQVVAPVLSRTRPEMASLRPGVLPAAAPDPARPPARVEAAPAPRSLPAGLERRRFAPELDEGRLALDAAPIVVCAGYGLGRDAIPEAVALATELGGALGATRRVCDVGWLPRQLQIGISGRSVAPALYLGLGVRGSFNHVVGMQRSSAVVAVNRDSEAEILACADLGVVADARALLSRLLERARARFRAESSRPG